MKTGFRGHLRAAARAVVVGLGLSSVFVASLVAAILLHLNLPPARSLARTIANQAFVALFQGKLVVGQIERLTLRGISIRSADAYDPSGQRVIHADGIRGDANVLAILRALLPGAGEIRIDLPRIELDHADVALQSGAEGLPTIASTFLPPPAPVGPPSPPGRGVTVVLERVHIHQAWAHGDLVSPCLDGEVADAVARLEVGHEGLTLDVGPTKTRLRAPLPADLVGVATFGLRRVAPELVTRMTLTLSGALGDLDVQANAQLAESHLTARVEVPRATALAIASLVPQTPPLEIPLRVPVSAVINVDSDLPAIAFRSELAFEGGGSLSADGSIELRAPFGIDLGLQLHEVPPTVVFDVPLVPPISGEGRLSIRAGPAVRVDASLATQPFALEGQSVPRLQATAVLSGGEWRGSLDAAEPGAPIHATFSADPRTGAVDASLDVAAPSLARVGGFERLHVPVDGAATLTAQGSLRAGALRVGMHGTLSGLREGGTVALASAAVSGQLEGRVDAPAALRLDLTAHGRGLHVGSRAWETVTLGAHGPLFTPRLEVLLDTGAGESWSASGTLDAKAKALAGVTASLRRPDGTTEAKLSRIQQTAGGYELRGVTASGGGVGALRADLTITGREISGTLRGENIDLEKVARIADYPGHLAGLVNVDLDLAVAGHLRGRTRAGHVSVEFVNLEAAMLRGVSGSATATFDGDRVRADAVVRIVDRAPPGAAADGCDGPFAALRVTGADARIPGSLLDPESWLRATGRAEVAADDWNLGCVRRLLPAFAGIPDVRGELTTRIVVERASGARFPSIQSLATRTRGLVVVARGWTSEHVDFDVAGSLDGKTGALVARASVLDGAPLATVAVDATLALAALLDQPEQRAALLRSTKGHVRVEVPRRAVSAFAGLPSFITDRVPLLTGAGGDALAGDIELTATLAGSLEHPVVAVELAGHGLAHVTIEGSGPGTGGRRLAPVLGSWGIPADIAATAQYDGARATMNATMDLAGRMAVRAKADLGLPVAQLLTGDVRPTGSFEVDLDRVPIGDVPFFADHEIAGALSGKIAMQDIGARPSLTADANVSGLKVGRITYERATLTVSIERPTSESKAQSPSKLAFELTSAEGGHLTATLTNQVDWERGLIPSIDAHRTGQLELKAQGFRLAVARPFVRSVVQGLDGVVDGDAVVAWSTGASNDEGFNKVNLKLRQGVFNLPALGQELRDVGFTLGGARGRLNLTELRAQGSTGSVTGTGFADFDGLAFRKAHVSLGIGNDSPLPLDLQGVPLGDVSGTVTLDAEAQKTGLIDIKVGLPRMRLDLAPSIGRSVQSEDPNPDVTIVTGSPTRDSAPALASAPARHVVITLDPVAVAIKGRIFGKVPIDGTIVGSKTAPIRVDIGGEQTRVSGTVDVPHFAIDLLHKRFVVDNATVKLNPDDLGRSLVNATARWDAPDQASFVLDFVGEATPLTADKLKAKLHCHSGSLSEEACLSALFVGPNAPTYVGGTTTGASVATQVLAAEFSTDIGGGLSTTVGTAADGSVRPGIQYNLGKAVLEVSTYGISGTMTPVAGGAAALATGQHALATLDWRFWRNFSLRGSFDYSNAQDNVGVDVLWQVRY